MSASLSGRLAAQAGSGAGPITSGGAGYGSAVVSGVPEQLADRKGNLNPKPNTEGDHGTAE